MGEQRFHAEVEGRRGGGIAIRLPFDPNAAWGDKDRHYVSGSISGIRIRATLVPSDAPPYVELGPSWCRDGRVKPGDEATVILAPEGPQVEALAPDVQAALAAEPALKRSFESLATFYRKRFVDGIEQAKRPETRARRISQMVEGLREGRREP